MAKKINFGTINETFINALSQYNQTLHLIDTLKHEHTATLATLTEKRDTMMNQRAQEVEDCPEITQKMLDDKYPLPSLLREIQAENAKYTETLKGYNDTLKNFIDIYIVSMGFYENYVDYMTRHVDTKLRDSYKTFFDTIGATGQDNDTALNKIVGALVDMIGVRMTNATNKKGEWSYIKTLSKTVYHKTFMSVLLHLLVNEKGVLTVNEDNSISMTVYEDETK